MARLGKLKAVTLMESLVAMVIITISLGAGTLVSSNVLQNDSNNTVLSATLILNEIALKEKEQKEWLDSEVDAGRFTIKIHFEQYMENENLQVMILSAFDHKGKLVHQHKEIIAL